MATDLPLRLQASICPCQSLQHRPLTKNRALYQLGYATTNPQIAQIQGPRQTPKHWGVTLKKPLLLGGLTRQNKKTINCIKRQVSGHTKVPNMEKVHGHFLDGKPLKWCERWLHPPRVVAVQNRTFPCRSRRQIGVAPLHIMRAFCCKAMVAYRFCLSMPAHVERLLHPFPVPTDVHHMEVDFAALKRQKNDKHAKLCVQEESLQTKKSCKIKGQWQQRCHPQLCHWCSKLWDLLWKGGWGNPWHSRGLLEGFCSLNLPARCKIKKKNHKIQTKVHMHQATIQYFSAGTAAMQNLERNEFLLCLFSGAWKWYIMTCWRKAEHSSPYKASGAWFSACTFISG